MCLSPKNVYSHLLIFLSWICFELMKSTFLVFNVLSDTGHWDQNFGIPYFYIFENSLWFLVTVPNFNSLRRLKTAFFGRFLSRFYGRHYWPLFRKLACKLAEVTSKAHLKPSTFTWLLATRRNCRRRKVFCQLFVGRP